jgi:glycosyltransferase involved in cell wall biosynthesis
MRIDQVVVGASPGDAITSAALNIRSLLRQVCPSEIYSHHIDRAMHNEVRPLSTYDWNRGNPKTDIIIFHSSIGDKKIEDFLTNRRERLVLIYHNISPPEVFDDLDPLFANLLRRGRSFLEPLRDRVTLALADSQFNANELLELGYRDVRVSPLLIDTDAMRNTESDWSLANHLRQMVDGPIILTVGQILPHKRPDLALQAFHILTTYLQHDANLVMVGPQRIPHYSLAIADLKDELNLHRAWITGAISQAELVAFYRAADVFLTVSEHEGFCVPLIEAMHMRVPIVARSHAAIPETLSDAGILLPSDAGAELVAEAIYKVINDDELQSLLRLRGEARAAKFDLEEVQATLLKHLESVA